ncbi:MAG: response regulator [Chthoniobacterales bacterium]|nr:response regulator [Chthoniobacterales bacterium]
MRADTRAASHVRIPYVHVLVVEDHADTRSVLVKLLTRWGHEVAEASTVASAITLLNNLRFDVLVSDIGLPDGNGLSVVAAAVASGSARLKVALTAHGNAQDRDNGMRAGFDHYLTKPCDVARLRTVISSG